MMTYAEWIISQIKKKSEIYFIKCLLYFKCCVHI